MSKLSDFVNSSAQDKIKTAYFDNQQKSTGATEQDVVKLYNKYKEDWYRHEYFYICRTRRKKGDY